MLKELLVENVALIEKVELSFKEGFNVLTGETGAGKSLVIDAINAITGERTSKNIIRHGENQAVVTAVFCDVSKKVKDKLFDFGITVTDDLIIKKQISQNSSQIRICGQPATASMVKDISLDLINIHGQHDSQQLLDPLMHVNYIDNVAQNSELLNEYKKEFDNLKSIKKQLDSIDTDEERKKRERELYEFQLKELDALDIKPGEKQALKEKFDLIRNSEDIRNSLSSALAALKGTNSQDGALTLCDVANHSLSAKGMESCNDLCEKLGACKSSLEGIVEQIENKLDSFELDAEQIKNITDRYHAINSAISKYGGSEQALFDFYNNAKASLDRIDNTEQLINKLENDLSDAENRLIEKGKKLTASRVKTAQNFQKDVMETLQVLDMPHVTFLVDIKPSRYTKNGCDSLEFLISANKGEPPKPIVKIASGGELSRIMLAIKSVLAKIDCVDTLIFDEIDIGISGKAAEKVAQKIKEVSLFSQVLCVTHLAQIACTADHHLLISKHTDNKRTITTVKPLDYEGRTNELARIIAGNSVSDSVLSTAREMIDRSKK